MSHSTTPKIIPKIPTQKYYNREYMEESVNDIPTKLWQRKIHWQLPVNMKLRGPLIKKTSIDNDMYTFFYTNIYEFYGY